MFAEHSATTGEDSSSRGPETAFVFAPSPLLTVTVEASPDDRDEVHLHPGGQGFWVARMLTALGVQATLCGPFGGESGSVLAHLIAAEGVQVRWAASSHGNGVYVHDRRSGERQEIAEMAPPVFARHELDELYSHSLAAGMAADVCVLGGPHSPDVLPADTYRRLAADLSAVGATVVADLSGEALTAALAGGVTVLKVSHEELIADGRAADDDPATLIPVMRSLADEGASCVVVSRAEDHTLALVDGEVLGVVVPPLRLADHRGAGDSMTAGMAAALARGSGPEDALRLGSAAGALNVTRRGLGTGERDVVEQLAERITVRRWNAEE